MAKELIERILQQYGVAATTVFPAQRGYRNESHAVMLKDGLAANVIIYKREQGILRRIKNANYVADFLAQNGVPARQTLSSRIVKLQSAEHATYAALYNYLPGQTIPWEAYTMKHLKLLGTTMSNMHASLKDLAQGDLRPVEEDYLVICERIEEYFADKGVRRAIKVKLGLASPDSIKRFITLLENTHALSDQQALHMDFVRGNILFDGEGEALRISGILDFEKAAWGHPILDIARTLAFLIVDCKYKEEARIRKYFLYSGYSKRGHSKLARVDLLDDLVSLFLLYDFYKFLRHNPYESLAHNEHFIRTRDALLQRRVISHSGA